jgi:DNA processing protein
VLANGLPRIYPNTNHGLAQEILAKNGAILSEYEPITPISKWQFLERNRLVAALADVIVVVEAGERSGTLNTAMHALEQGKELMAVPGNITAPLSVGCNRLIAQGATPVLSVDDIFAKLNLSPANTKSPELANLTVSEALIFQLIHDGNSDGDELIAKSKLSPAEVSGTLTMLEIYGLIRPLGANKWAAK